MKNFFYAIRPLALDLLSTLVFVAIAAVTHDPLLATAIAVAAGFARVLYLLANQRRIAAMQWLSLGMVVVFGGASLLTHDARFMMVKPTLVYVLTGVAMLERGWMLPYMPPAARGRIGDGVLVGWGYAWAGLMFATAALNMWFALATSFATWTAFLGVFPLVSKFALFGVQYVAMRKIAIAHRRREVALQEPVAA